MSKKRILILTADAGYGHRSAAAAIEAALQELYNDRSEVSVINPMDAANAPEIIRQIEDGYDDLVVEDAGLYNLAYQIIDAPVVSNLVGAVTTHLLDDLMLQLIRDYHPDVIVSTFPIYAEPTAKALNRLGEEVTLAVVITDLANVENRWFSPSATMHFVPTPLIREQALENNIPATRIRVTGLPVDPAFGRDGDDKAQLREKLGWRVDAVTGLIVASPRTQQMQSIARVLDRAHIDLQLVFVCGGDERLYRTLKQEEWQGHFHLYGWIDNMPELMKASDFLVAKAGGLIVSEALACGLPLILSEMLPGQEVGNARYVVEHQAGAWAPGPVETLATVYEWLKDIPPQLETIQANARQLGDPRAAYEIAEGIWGLAGAAN